MLATKKALWSLLSGDAILAALLEQAPYMGRLPDTAKITRVKGALVISGDATPARGGKEEQTIVIDVWTLTHDLAEAIYERLIDLLHPGQPTQWGSLAVLAGKARIRLDSAIDLPDATSELHHKVVRFRVLYART